MLASLEAGPWTLDPESQSGGGDELEGGSET